MSDKDRTVCTLDGREYKIITYSIWSDTEGNDVFSLEILANIFPGDCKTLMSDSLEDGVIHELKIKSIDRIPTTSFIGQNDLIVIDGYIHKYDTIE